MIHWCKPLFRGLNSIPNYSTRDRNRSLLVLLGVHQRYPKMGYGYVTIGYYNKRRQMHVPISRHNRQSVLWPSCSVPLLLWKCVSNFSACTHRKVVAEVNVAFPSIVWLRLLSVPVRCSRPILLRKIWKQFPFTVALNSLHCQFLSTFQFVELVRLRKLFR